MAAGASIEVHKWHRGFFGKLAGDPKDMKQKSHQQAREANVIGSSLRKFRMERGLTQEQLAAQCQVRGIIISRSTLAKIEIKLRYIKACELFVIAKILKIPMERFYPPNFP